MPGRMWLQMWITRAKEAIFLQTAIVKVFVQVPVVFLSETKARAAVRWLLKNYTGLEELIFLSFYALRIQD